MSIKHTIRSKDGGTINVNLTPVRAIRLQCVECMGHQPLLVQGCTDPKCSLFPYRMGRDLSAARPNASGKIPPSLVKRA